MPLDADSPAPAPSDSPAPARTAGRALHELDGRTLPHGGRHEIIFAALDELALGEAFVILNDHDPRPLRCQFDAQHPEQLHHPGLAQRQDVGLMIIKTVARRNWPRGDDHTYSTWYEPWDQQRRITAAVSWVLGREEATGLATPGDVGLLGMVVQAEANRISREEAEEVMGDAPEYSSPFIAMPF